MKMIDQVLVALIFVQQAVYDVVHEIVFERKINQSADSEDEPRFCALRMPSRPILVKPCLFFGELHSP